MTGHGQWRGARAPLALVGLAVLAGLAGLVTPSGGRAEEEPPSPGLLLDLRPVQLVGPGGGPVRVAALAGCAAACELRLEGEVELGRSALRLRPVGATLAAGEQRRFELVLRRAGAKRLRRALARGRKARAVVEARAERLDGVGELVGVASEVRLRPAFAVLGVRVGPRLALVDGRRPARARFRFQAPGPVRLRVRVVRRSGGTVWARALRSARPFRPLAVRWRGFDRGGEAAPDGRYRFELARPGGRWWRLGSFRLRGFVFPVAGPTGLRGPVGAFGAPRNGGRTHEGLDITAPCGRRVLAARGGRVRRIAYEPALKGHYAVIRDTSTGADYVYSHFPTRSPLRQGGRVHTGELVGRVGQSGNAASTPCHLHFEVWPRGWHRGNPVDPAPLVRDWLRR